MTGAGSALGGDEASGAAAGAGVAAVGDVNVSKERDRSRVGLNYPQI